MEGPRGGGGVTGRVRAHEQWLALNRPRTGSTQPVHAHVRCGGPARHVGRRGARATHRIGQGIRVNLLHLQQGCETCEGGLVMLCGIGSGLRWGHDPEEVGGPRACAKQEQQPRDLEVGECAKHLEESALLGN